MSYEPITYADIAAACGKTTAQLALDNIAALERIAARMEARKCRDAHGNSAAAYRGQAEMLRRRYVGGTAAADPQQG